MFKLEAKLIADQCKKFSATELSPMLNIGSSDLNFRTQIQPWIQEELIDPIENLGVEIIHCDLKPMEGVDIVGNIFDDEVFNEIRKINAKSLICSNILEHVQDPREFLERCLELIEPEGIIFITVPYDYPYHADPIDTMFRPTPEEVLALMGNRVTTVTAEIHALSSYRETVKKRPWLLLRPILRFPFPFVNWDKWKRSMKKLYYLFNDYKQTLLVVRKVS